MNDVAMVVGGYDFLERKKQASQSKIRTGIIVLEIICRAAEFGGSVKI